MAKLPYSFLAYHPEPRAFATGVIDMFNRVARAINNADFGTTAARPTSSLTAGQFYFDTTLGKPVWYKTSTATWVDATGANV